jgi:hypothetical protein
MKFVIASSLCSIILTSVLIGYYENKPIVHQQAFSMAVICITGVFFVISSVVTKFRGVGSEYNNRGLIVFFCLVIQIACIVLSVLVYCNVLNNFIDDDG